MLTSTRAWPALEEAANWLTCAECARQVACANRTDRAAQDGFSTGPIRTNCTAGRIFNRSNPNGLQIQPTSSEAADKGQKVLEEIWMEAPCKPLAKSVTCSPLASRIGLAWN